MTGQNKALVYLDKAVNSISQIIPSGEAEQLPVQSLVQQVAEFGPDQAMSIALVLSRQSVFNEMVRQEITGMEIANRYDSIASGFTSIRQDTGKQLQLIEKGKVTFMEKMSLRWGDFRRGTVSDRFDKIKKHYIGVSNSLNTQIEKETNIIGAYSDYRFAMKDSETQAHIMLENAEKILESARIDLENAQLAIDGASEDLSASERSSLELTRDEMSREFGRIDDRYQIAKDLADQLRIAYNASEFVFARLKQTSQVKKRLYDQGVAFFSANEIVFTGQAAAFNSTQGLSEGTKTLTAMQDGMNQGLEDLANMGGQVLEAGLRAGYSTGLRAESVKKLVDSVVDFQESSIKLVQELRNEATVNAQEVGRISEDGKQRFARLISRTQNQA